MLWCDSCLSKTAVQDLDYENELELLYAVVSVSEGEQTRAQLCFLDDETGRVLKTIPIPTWKQVSISRQCLPASVSCVLLFHFPSAPVSLITP